MINPIIDKDGLVRLWVKLFAAGAMLGTVFIVGFLWLRSVQPIVTEVQYKWTCDRLEGEGEMKLKTIPPINDYASLTNLEWTVKSYLERDNPQWAPVTVNVTGWAQTRKWGSVINQNGPNR